MFIDKFGSLDVITMLCHCHHVTRRCVCHTLGECLKVRIPSGCKILDCQKMDDFLRCQHVILKRAPLKLVILETADSFVPGSLLTFLSPISMIQQFPMVCRPCGLIESL